MGIDLSKIKKDKNYRENWSMQVAPVSNNAKREVNTNIASDVQARNNLTVNRNASMADVMQSAGRRIAPVNTNSVVKSILGVNENRILASVENPLMKSKNTFDLTEKQVGQLSQMDKKDSSRMIGSLPVGNNEKGKINTKIDSLRRTNENMKKANKINEDVKNGRYSSAIGHVLSGVPNEAMNSVVNTGTMLASLNPQTRDRENLVNTGKFLAKGYQERNSMIDNSVVRTAGNVSGAIGNMAPSIATGILTGGAGILPNAVQGMGVMSSEYLNTLNENQDNQLKAFFTGIAKGGVSMATERLTGGNIISKGSVDDIVRNKLAQSTLSNGKKWLASKVYEFGGEIAEENLENMAGYLIDYVINQKGITLQDVINDAKQTSSDTFWTTLTLNALGLGGNTYKEVKQQELNNKNNIEEIKETKLQENRKDELVKRNRQEENQIANMLANRYGVESNHNNIMIKKQNGETSNLFIDKNSSVNELQRELNTNKQLDNKMQDVSEQILQNEGMRLQDNEVLQNNEKITEQENKITQNANMEQDIEKVNEFNGYSQKEIQNIKSDKIKIAESKQDISNFVQQSRSVPNNFKMYLGKVKQNIADTIKSRLGIDVNNYNISLSADSIRHTIKKHSNVDVENARGQVALTSEDFQNIPDIINNPDNIELSGKSKQGKPSIKFEKNINGNNVVITYTSDKHKNLELQTMYKFKNDKKIDSVTASNVETLNTTSETSSDTNLSNTIIPQNENKMQVLNEKNSLANSQEIGYNNLKLGERKNIFTKELMSLYNGGGYRTNEQILDLRRSIQENGITEPIEIYRKNDGTYGIENGNHRLQIANELGIENVPVKLVESWENVGVTKDNTEINILNERIDENDGSNTTSKGSIETNERSGSSRGRLYDLDDQSQNRGTTEGDVGVSKRTSNSNEQTSYVENKGNSGKIENSNESSFSLQGNNELFDYLDSEHIDYEIDKDGNIISIEDPTAITRFNYRNIDYTKTKEITLNKTELQTNPLIYEDENVRAFKLATDNMGKDISTEQIDEMAETGELPDTMRYISSKRRKHKASSGELLDSFMQKFVNKGHYMDKLANKTGNKELTYKYDRTMNAFNEAQYSIGEEQVNSKGEVVGESLKQIFEGAEEAGLEKEFGDYLLNKHNIARIVAGKSLYGDEVSAPQSSRIVADYETKHPEFKEWSQKVSKYNENNLQDMVDTGMLSQDMFNRLRSLYGDYIPTYRDIIDEKVIFDDNSVGSNVLGRATGGDQKILDPKEAMAEQTLAIKKAIRMNELGVELYKTLGKDSKVFDGIDFDAGAIQSLAGDVIQKAQDGMNTFVIFEDGQMTQFKISDDLYTAFQKDTLSNRIRNDKLANALLAPVEKLSKAQRDLLTTYSIGFSFNNPIKDIQDAIFNTKYSVSEFAKNYVKSLYQLGTKGEIYKDYIRNGGNSNTYFDYEGGVLPNRSKVQKVVDKIKSFNEILEQAPRLAEYITTLENGGTKSEALYNGAEITTNFKRGGEITKIFNRYGANFLNASVQGLDKQIRNITGQNGVKGYANLITRATVLGVAPSVLNHLLLSGSDDEEYYEDLPDYIKDSYYLFPKGKDGEFYRIPKGRVVATLGIIGRNFTEYIQGEQDLLETAKNSVSGVVDNLAPNNPFKENLIAPVVQAKRNEAWYGGEIEGTRLQKLPVAERTDEKTDELSNKISEVLQSNDITKYIADKLGISPKKINYVLDQYSGGVGDVLLPMATPYAENNIISDKFITDSVLKNKNVEVFYTELQNSELLNNSEFASDTDKIVYKYLSSGSKEIGELYAKKRDVQSSDLPDSEKKKQSKELQAQINEKVKKTLNDLEEMKISGDSASLGGEEYYKVDGEWKVMSDGEKEKMGNLSLDTYADYKNKTQEATLAKRNSTGKEGAQLSSIEKMQILQSSNYSSKEKDEIYSNYIMSKSEDKKSEYEELKEYYKDNSRVGGKNYKAEEIINQYLDYKVKANEKLAELKASGEKEEGQSLDSSEKTQLLVDSKYSKEQTEALYVNVIASESNKNKYEILKSMNKGNSIDAYLKFMLSDREADKEDDGTKSGKTISGTKKEKIVNTINGLNLNKTAKIYLLATEYNLNTNAEKSNYNTLLSYIKSLDSSEQVKIVKTLKGKTEMKDGSFEW